MSLARASSAARPAAVAFCRSMSSGVSFSGAYTTASNPLVTPHPAPVSHAPVNYAKNRLQFQVEDPANQKTAQEYIDDVPVIEVDGPTAICDGGDPRLGHPIEFIQLNKVRAGQPATCKYCGLRFIQSHHH